MVGQMTIDRAKLSDGEEALSERTSILSNETHVVRLVDRALHTLVYLAYSTKVMGGSPFNSLSTVPVVPWSAPETVGATGARSRGPATGRGRGIHGRRMCHRSPD